jgi:hypothetical protein
VALTSEVVTVAVLGPNGGYPVMPDFDGPGFENQGTDVPYAERVKVEVEVTEVTPLAEIIDTAAARLGITNQHGGRVCDALTGVVFYEPEDEVSFKWREQPWQSVIRLADDSGLPSWAVPWTETRFGELLAASDAQLVAGDPRRPYFWPVRPQGEGLQTFLVSLYFLWSAWEHVLAGYGTLDLARRIRNRVARADEVFDQENWAVPWEKRLARPHDFFSYVTGRPRTVEEIASLLGCPVEQAEAVLWGMGLSCGDDGLWTVAGDEPASLLTESVLMIRELGQAPRQETIAALFRGSGHSKARLTVAAAIAKLKRIA